MKKLFYILGILANTVFFYSCEDVIEFKADASAPMLVTHVLATPDSILYAQVTKSVFFLDITTDPLKDKNGNYLGIANAEVKLYINDIYKETMTLTSADSGIYKASYIPLASEKVHIEVSTPAFDKTAKGSTVLPKSISFTADTSITYEEEIMRTYINGVSYLDTIVWKRTYFNFNFLDDGFASNYYGISVVDSAAPFNEDLMTYEDYNIEMAQTLTSEDNVIFDGFERDDKMLLFDDSKIQGQNTSLSFYLVEQTFSSQDSALLGISPTPKNFKLKFFNLNKDAYLFLYSARKNDATANASIFSEPSQVYSNITNGIGIIGGYSVAVKQW